VINPLIFTIPPRRRVWKNEIKKGGWRVKGVRPDKVGVTFSEGAQGRRGMGGREGERERRNGAIRGSPTQ